MPQSLSIKLYGTIARLPLIGPIVRTPIRLAKALIRREIAQIEAERESAEGSRPLNVASRLAACEAGLRSAQQAIRAAARAAAAKGDDSAPTPETLAGPVRFDVGLERYGRKQYSQNDEDGIIEYLTDRLGIKKGYFVEFGVGPAGGKTIQESGLECNSRLLLEQGWQGLFMDGQTYPAEYQVENERITALNINTLFDKYGVPLDFELLSIDVDGQDFWIWMAMRHSPAIVIVEYNPSLHIDQSCVMPFDVSYVWDGTQYYGASLLALHKLGSDKGYTLVYANGVNAFFVRTDLMANPADFTYEAVYNYRGRLLYHRADPLDRAYLRV